MRRREFEHVIAAVAEVSGEQEIVVIGSQAILGSFPEPPDELLISMEVDVFPLRAPGKAEEIDGSLGDGSQFQRTFGLYAHGVGPETAKAPKGWMARLVRSEIPPRIHSRLQAVALCLEIHDLVLAKCVAGRPRDWSFARDALAAGLVDFRELDQRIGALPGSAEAQTHIRRMLAGMTGAVQEPDAAAIRYPDVAPGARK